MAIEIPLGVLDFITVSINIIAIYIACVGYVILTEEKNFFKCA